METYSITQQNDDECNDDQKSEDHDDKTVKKNKTNRFETKKRKK